MGDLLEFERKETKSGVTIGSMRATITSRSDKSTRERRGPQRATLAAYIRANRWHFSAADSTFKVYNGGAKCHGRGYWSISRDFGKCFRAEVIPPICSHSRVLVRGTAAAPVVRIPVCIVIPYGSMRQRPDEDICTPPVFLATR